MTDVNELIAKVHDHMEGRYDLDSLDFHNIHAALCELQRLKSDNTDSRDLGLTHQTQTKKEYDFTGSKRSGS